MKVVEKKGEGEEEWRMWVVTDVARLYPWWPVSIVPADSDISEILVKKNECKLAKNLVYRN